MSEILLTVLGSSAGMPQPDRANSGYVLEYDGRLLQIDCGGGVSSAFRRAGYDPLDVNAVIISHTHPDHISDLPLFIQMQYLSTRKSAIDIYLPSEAIDAVKAYFTALYLLPEKLPFSMNFRPVTDKSEFQIGGISARAILNTHLEGHRSIIEEFDLPHKMQCYSYLFRAAGKSILYSADLGSEQDILPYMKRLDLLVTESTHIDLNCLFDAAVENEVAKVVLTHIDVGFDIKNALDGANRAGLSNLVIAEDGMRISL